MVARYPKIDLNTVYNNMCGVVRLEDVAHLVPGYYSKYTSIFKLIDCDIKDNLRIEGYSTMLRHSVIIERDAVRALVTAKDVDDFVDADLQRYSAYLITANHHEDNFRYQYPLAANYLRDCMRGDMESVLNIAPIIRPSIRGTMDKIKLILSASHGICHAMLDEETHVVPTAGSYICTFLEDDRRTMMGYMAILNSRTFSYIFNQRLQDNDMTVAGYKSVLYDTPVPGRSKYFAILEYLSDYLLYLSTPELRPIAKHISNERIGFYLTKILDMVIYELYFPEYVEERNLNAIEYIDSAPFMNSSIVDEEHIWETYSWFQRPDNVIRQMIEVLDTRSPELLYKIQKFNPNE